MVLVLYFMIFATVVVLSLLLLFTIFMKNQAAPATCRASCEANGQVSLMRGEMNIHCTNTVADDRNLVVLSLIGLEKNHGAATSMMLRNADEHQR